MSLLSWPQLPSLQNGCKGEERTLEALRAPLPSLSDGGGPAWVWQLEQVILLLLQVPCYQSHAFAAPGEESQAGASGLMTGHRDGRLPTSSLQGYSILLPALDLSFPPVTCGLVWDICLSTTLAVRAC